jgi:hypothetical protein
MLAMETRDSCTSGYCCPQGDGERACKDLMNDTDNCGFCAFACDTGQSCVKGLCVDGEGDTCADINCPQGMDCCDEFGTAYCTSFTNSNENCGSCNNYCASNENCIDGVCTAKEDQECSSGTYICFLGETCCYENGQATCLEILNSDMHCGSCENVCGAYEKCIDGVCRPSAVEYDPCWCGTTNCGIGGNIECRDLANDVENCGGCGIACGSESECVDGICKRPYDPEEYSYVDLM